MSSMESLLQAQCEFKKRMEIAKAATYEDMEVLSAMIPNKRKLFLERLEEKQSYSSKMTKISNSLQQLMDEGNLAARERDRLEDAKQAALDRAEELKESSILQEKKLTGIRERILLYYERLGMELKNCGENHVIIIFRKLDPKQPEMGCYFHLLLDDRVYRVTNCFPELADVEVLVSELNETTNINKFFVSMRKMFQKAVCNL